MEYQQQLAQQLQQMTADFEGSGARSVMLTDVFVDLALAADRSAIAGAAAAPAMALVDLLRRPAARVVIWGDAGAGKSTLLRRVALAYAASAAGEPEGAADILSDMGEAPLPVIIDLGSVDAAAEPDALLDVALGAHAAVARRALERGEAVLFVDGIEPANAVAAQQLLIRLVQRFPSCRIAAAQRSDAEMAALPDMFERYQVVRLDKERMVDLFGRWYRALAAGASADDQQIARLAGDLQHHEGLLQLASLPLAAVLCAAATVEGLRFPAARGILASRFARALMGRSGQVEEGWLPALAEVALAAPIDDAPFPAAVVDAAIAAAGIADPAARAAQIARWRSAGVIIGSDGQLRFPTPALREGLASRALAARADFIDIAAQLRETPQRHEALVLAAAARADDGWITQLIAAADRRPPPPRAATRRSEAPRSASRELLDAWRDLLLAAEILVVSAAPLAAERAAARSGLLAMISAIECPAALRVTAGRLLGELGDPRFDDLLPPLTAIDGGMFLIGADVPGYEEEGPAQRIDVPAFQIGIFPVTNREYARFLDENSGYPLPHYWSDPRFNGPSLPVVGVTWHDAAAYAAWLTERLDRAGLLPAGMVVRLPVEAEWEKAATWGPKARRKQTYPWGERWDATRANIAEGRGAWLTTPVGCFPGGVSAYGVHDLIGNIWEWTASEYASYPGANPPFRHAGSFVLRGSSCVATAVNTRATYRSSHLPASYWRYHLGFRIVIARPLADDIH